VKGFDDLKGKIFIRVENIDNEIIEFEDELYIYRLYHEQDCCENVTVDDINGDLNDLIGSEILFAEQSQNDEFPSEYGSETWTFYKIATKKGWVDIRWFGESNGYYSEYVDFEVVKKGE